MAFTWLIKSITNDYVMLEIKWDENANAVGHDLLVYLNLDVDTIHILSNYAVWKNGGWIAKKKKRRKKIKLSKRRLRRTAEQKEYCDGALTELVEFCTDASSQRDRSLFRVFLLALRRSWSSQTHSPAVSSRFVFFSCFFMLKVKVVSFPSYPQQDSHQPPEGV